MLPFLSLPSDVLILVISHLSVADILTLTEVCHKLNQLVSVYLFRTPVRVNPRYFARCMNSAGGSSSGLFPGRPRAWQRASHSGVH